ncbi:MAG: LEA type 2 family protein [archaeon]|nr:LEA type 2 family protein [archaeon]
MDTRKVVLAMMVIAMIVIGILIICCLESEIEQREALLDCEITPNYLYPTGWGPVMLPPNPQIPSYVDMWMSVNIYNPNDITATLDRMDYTIYANGGPTGMGYFAQRIDIPAMESRDVITTYRVDLTNAPSLVISAIQSGALTWGIGGTVYIDTPIGALEIPFYKELPPRSM